MGKHFTRIRQARELAHLSQAELADKFGVTGPTTSNWENGVSSPWDEQYDRVLAWVESVERGSGAERSFRGDIGTSEDADQGDAAALRCLRQIYDQCPQSRIAEALSVSQVGSPRSVTKVGRLNGVTNRPCFEQLDS